MKDKKIFGETLFEGKIIGYETFWEKLNNKTNHEGLSPKCIISFNM